MNTHHKIVLSVRDLKLSYKSRSGLFKGFEHEALKGISFDLLEGETLGIIGRNGCGKSTLLRLIAGIVKPTDGKIVCDESIKRALLALGLGFRPDLSGRDNALIGIMLQGYSKKDALDFLSEVKEFSELGVFFEQPVKTYSAGMRARLGFASALKTDVDILLIDEVLSVGDAHFKKKAEKALADRINSQQTVVFISHNFDQINNLCDRAIWLKDGMIEKEGDTQSIIIEYRNSLKNGNG